MSILINTSFKVNQLKQTHTKKSQNNTSIPSKQVANENKEETNIQKEKNKSQITKKIIGNFLYVFSINDEGEQVLLMKIPVKQITKNSSDNGSVFGNPKFYDNSTINTTRAAFNYNQQLLHKKDSENDIKNLLNSLMAV